MATSFIEVRGSSGRKNGKNSEQTTFFAVGVLRYLWPRPNSPRPSGSMMQSSGSIMFGHRSVHFPVSLWSGGHITLISSHIPRGREMFSQPEHRDATKYPDGPSPLQRYGENEILLSLLGRSQRREQEGRFSRHAQRPNYGKSENEFSGTVVLYRGEWKLHCRICLVKI